MLARMNRNDVPASWDDFFNHRVFNHLNTVSSNSNTPAVNVSEDEKGFTIEMAAPGIARNDFNLEIDNDILTISAEQKESKEEQKPNYLRREFNYHTFKRSFMLPESVDQEQIKASHESGILRLSLPKKEEEVQKAPRQIAVQ
jgi:HSP20 family protein